VNHGNPPTAFATASLSPGGNFAALRVGDTRIVVLSTATGKELGAFEAPDQMRVMGAALTADGTRLATTNARGVLRVWDVANPAKPAAEYPVSKGSIVNLALSADGKRAIMGGNDFIFREWDLEKGVAAFEREGHHNSVSGVAFSPDEKRFASGGMDQEVRIWDAASGRELAAFKRLNSGVLSVAFSADGAMLMYGCRNGSMGIYDFNRAERMLALEGQVAAAQQKLINAPDDAAAHQVLGEWLTILGAWREAAEHMEAAGGAVSPVALGRCYWLMAQNEPDPARRMELFEKASKAYTLALERVRRTPPQDA
jgi:hypothetical protein